MVGRGDVIRRAAVDWDAVDAELQGIPSSFKEPRFDSVKHVLSLLSDERAERELAKVRRQTQTSGSMQMLWRRRSHHEHVQALGLVGALPYMQFIATCLPLFPHAAAAKPECCSGHAGDRGGGYILCWLQPCHPELLPHPEALH